MSQKTLGQYLRELRKQQGFTQEQLAQRAQVSKRAIVYWEKDEYRPHGPEMQALLTALGISPREQTSVLLNLMPLRGEKVVRQDAILQASAQDMPLPGAGDLLAALRLRKGLTREQAAAQLRTTMTTLGRWENNRFGIPEAMLPLIQSVLNVRPAELQALRQRMALPQEPEEPFSLERCHQWVNAFQALRYAPGARSIDLEAIALQRKLWLLATEHPEARSVLALAILRYGDWLVSQNRGVEVYRQAQRAFNIYAEERFQDDYIAPALNLLSWCKAFAFQPKPEQGERFLRQWFPRLNHSPAQMNIMADTALYAAQAGRPDLALRYFQDAWRVYEMPDHATEVRFQYLQITHARILLHNGSPQEAYATLTRILPLPQNDPANIALTNALMFAEIMFAANERAETEKWLRAIYARLQIQEAPRMQEKADKLARQL